MKVEIRSTGASRRRESIIRSEWFNLSVTFKVWRGERVTSTHSTQLYMLSLEIAEEAGKKERG